MDLAKAIVTDYKKIIYNIGIKEIGQLEKILIDFAISRKLILYGGSAIDIFLRKTTGGKKFLYEPGTKLTDYDFYSDNFIVDANDLGKIISNAGFKFVRISNGKTNLTRSIRIGTNFKAVCDINYIKTGQRQMITANKNPLVTDNGIMTASPFYLILDQYLNTFMNLFRYEFRINSAFEKLTLMESVLHPGAPIDIAPELQKHKQSGLDKIYALNNKIPDLVISGDMAFYWYINGEPLVMMDYEPIFYTNYLKKEVIYKFDELLPTKLEAVGGEVNDKELLAPFNVINIRQSISYIPVGKYRIVTPTGLLYSYYYCKLLENATRFDNQIAFLVSRGFHTEEKVSEIEILLSQYNETVLTKAKQEKFN